LRNKRFKQRAPKGLRRSIPDRKRLKSRPYGALLIQGIATTIHLSLLAWLLATVLGVAIGVLRVLPQRPARFLGAAYVQVFRNTPFLVHLFFWYFAAPSLLPRGVEEWFYHHVGNYSYWAGVLGLGT
jgi:glutamate/aspartate transport system permease protein